MNYINEVVLRRRNKIVVDFTIDTEIDNLGRVMVMMKHVQELGYTFSKELIEQMRHCTTATLDNMYLELIGYLKSYVGANKVYNFMYPNFPQQVIEADTLELLVNAVIHYWSDGTLLPDYEKDARLPLFETTDFVVLDYGTKSEATEIARNLMSSKTSLSQNDKNDLIWLLQNGYLDGNDMPEISFKENLPIISKLIIENTSNVLWLNLLKLYYKTATDVLRLAVHLSGGDVSLSTPTKFKSMSRARRKLLLQLLDNCGNIEEDMKRHQMSWIKLGEVLHPNESRYKCFDKVVEAFDKLRNNGYIRNFGGDINYILKHGDVDAAVKMLKNRPGELARMLDYLLREFPDHSSQIISAFESVASAVSVPVLLQVKEHFNHRDAYGNTRVFFPKGNLAKVYTVNKEIAPIAQNVCCSIVCICEVALIEQFKNKEAMKNVYIADCMKNYCIPQSQRSANAAMKIITRGSRFNLKEDTKYIRLGIHWMNEIDGDYDEEDRTDIDLSCSFLDKNFSSIDHISYTHLKNSYAVHSGDLVDAPRRTGGSAECIDIDIEKAIQVGVRYAAVQVYGFTNSRFCNLDDLLFNWQEGVDPNIGEIFEPARIQQCMNLGGNTSCEIPVIFDLQNHEVIWCDLNLTTRTNFPRCVEGNVQGLSATAMGIVQSYKPTMYDVAVLNAMARGKVVTKREDADIIVDIDTTPVIEEFTKYIEVQNEAGEVINTRTEIAQRVKECKFITPFMTDIWMSEML